MTGPRQRLESIDAFRGFSIVLMTLADYIAGPAVVPAWLKHPSEVGFTVIDIIAPMFITAIGLTFGLSFRGRLARDGLRKTVEHFLSRNLALIGLGALFTTLGNISGAEVDPSNWGLLQAIGVAGLITLVFIRMPVRLRWLAGLLLLAVYQVLLSGFWLFSVASSTHGGLIGALSWGAMLIMATALGDMFHDAPRGRRWFPWIGIAMLGLGLLLAPGVPISKHRVSASYVLLSLGISAIIFWCFHLAEQRFGHASALLVTWGRNSLILYLLHGALLGIVVMPPVPWWYKQAPVWLVVLQALSMVSVMSWIAWTLDRKHFQFSL
ncbi:MAG: heparan-alpha-glucosaminide N-acetyltransferase domain-containing protein [Candidatus Cryosericum sp.]|nr:heparan-alpha-glucosaminide N-acetyltransferase domain-containing protein [bacterium]